MEALEDGGRGDRVATWSIWTGTHRSDFFGVPGTGNQVSVEAWTFDYFRDGMMAESRIIMDVMGLMQQLGAIPGSPPSTD
jgi:predicted ester cyclase